MARSRGPSGSWTVSTLSFNPTSTFVIRRFVRGCRLVDCIDSHGEPNELLVFEVESSDVVHANQKDEVFLRVGDENRRLSFVQRQELLFDKGQASYEARSSRAQASWTDLWTRSCWPNTRQRFKRVPIAWGCSARLAGVLPRHTSGCCDTGRSAAGARQQLVRSMTSASKAPIPAAASETTKDQVERLQPTCALRAAGRFEDVPLVPDDVWLEGIVNAAVHRSYSLVGDHIRVEIFDDRIEISSPGRFPGLVDLE